MLSFHQPLPPSAHLLTSQQDFPAFPQPDAAPFPKERGGGGVTEMSIGYMNWVLVLAQFFIIDTGWWNLTTIDFVCVCAFYIYNFCYCLMVWLCV